MYNCNPFCPHGTGSKVLSKLLNGAARQPGVEHPCLSLEEYQIGDVTNVADECSLVATFDDPEPVNRVPINIEMLKTRVLCLCVPPICTLEGRDHCRASKTEVFRKGGKKVQKSD